MRNPRVLPVPVEGVPGVGREAWAGRSRPRGAIKLGAAGPRQECAAAKARARRQAGGPDHHQLRVSSTLSAPLSAAWANVSYAASNSSRAYRWVTMFATSSWPAASIVSNVGVE